MICKKKKKKKRKKKKEQNNNFPEVVLFHRKLIFTKKFQKKYRNNISVLYAASPKPVKKQAFSFGSDVPWQKDFIS